MVYKFAFDIMIKKMRASVQLSAHQIASPYLTQVTRYRHVAILRFGVLGGIRTPDFYRIQSRRLDASVPEL